MGECSEIFSKVLYTAECKQTSCSSKRIVSVLRLSWSPFFRLWFSGLWDHVVLHKDPDHRFLQFHFQCMTNSVLIVFPLQGLLSYLIFPLTQIMLHVIKPIFGSYQPPCYITDQFPNLHTSILKTKVGFSSETSISVCKTRRCHNPQDHNMMRRIG